MFRLVVAHILPPDLYGDMTLVHTATDPGEAVYNSVRELSPELTRQRVAKTKVDPQTFWYIEMGFSYEDYVNHKRDMSLVFGDTVQRLKSYFPKLIELRDQTLRILEDT